jgi:hypothetical protein
MWVPSPGVVDLVGPKCWPGRAIDGGGVVMVLDVLCYMVRKCLKCRLFIKLNIRGYMSVLALSAT